MFGYGSDVVFGSHKWPTFGQKELITRIYEQRDMYGYLHGQTVWLMNIGLTGIEIAEKLDLPPNVSKAWYCRGFYGFLSHNVKGIYQRYMTWFGGNPSHLWQYLPKEEDERYIDCIGGLDALCDKDDGYIKAGDSRFAATLLGRAREDGIPFARKIETAVHHSLRESRHGSYNATWRKLYLVAAKELRTGRGPGLLGGGRTPLGPSLTVEQWFDIISVQIDGEEAAARSQEFTIDFDLVDIEERWRLIVSSGVLVYRDLSKLTHGNSQEKADLVVGLKKMEFLGVFRGREVHFVKAEGNLSVL